MIDGVIFDMDGLMFDTERVWATLWEPALATLGLSYKEGLDVAARGTAGDTMRAVLRRFYGENCDTDAIIEALHAQAEKAFQAPPPKKPGLDEILSMAGRAAHPHGGGLLQPDGVYPAPFGRLGPDPLLQGHRLRRAVLGLQARPGDLFAGSGGAGHCARPHPCAGGQLQRRARRCQPGGFVTVMVPDMAPANDEMRRLYTAECRDLYEVKKLLEAGKL